MGNSYDKHPSTTAKTPVRKSSAVVAVMPKPKKMASKVSTTTTRSGHLKTHRLTPAAQPKEWTDQVKHKYCGTIDNGRIGKPNKAHRCEACLAIKGQQSKYRNGPKDIKACRDDKSSLKFQVRFPADHSNSLSPFTHRLLDSVACLFCFLPFSLPFSQLGDFKARG